MKFLHIASFPIHADFDSVLLQEPREGLTGELGTLVGVEDFRSILAQCLLQSINTEIGVQRIRQAPGKHVPAVHVYDGYQVKESP